MIFLLPLVTQPFPFGADFDGKSRQKHGLSPRIRFFVLRNRACFFRTSGRVRYYREAYREKEKGGKREDVEVVAVAVSL